ncbi:MAG TPA: TetR/AcrR family transcriptional regulator [Thermoleophilaceae bacterium]|nr:TetR/AcrR family transcriptional regulator [Thermoleophilaceae bacterium]
MSTRTEPRPPRKRLTAEQRREAILDAALEVFARRGFNGASIDEIAQAAGVSKALIYEHFPSKRDLHISLLERSTQEIFERLAESAANSDPGDVRLRAGVDAFLEFVERRRDAFRMLFRDAVEPEVAEILAGVQRQAAAAVAGMIATEPRANPDGDPEREGKAIEMLGQQLTGAVQSLAIWWGEHPEVPREALVESVMNFAWVGLERLRAGDRFSG